MLSSNMQFCMEVEEFGACVVDDVSLRYLTARYAKILSAEDGFH